MDVFLGDELWLDGEKYEEEEELRKRYPLMTGDDHYDPVRPDPAKNCISRWEFRVKNHKNWEIEISGDVMDGQCQRTGGFSWKVTSE